MNIASAASYYRKNLRLRTERSNETVVEANLRRERRSEADSRRRSKRVCIRDDIAEHFCGTLSEECECCGALFWNGERNSSKKFTRCCHGGKVVLPPLEDAPELMVYLLTDDTPECKNYRQRIREYNSGMAFASMGAQIKPPPGSGPYCYRLHGQVYHKVSPLYADQHKEGYGQLYIYDSGEATEKRASSNEKCVPNVFKMLDAMLRDINPFASSYMQMHKVAKDNPSASVKMMFLENGGLDMRRFNAPTVRTEVAAIFVGDNGEPPAKRDICIYPKGDVCQNISPLNQWCDPMTYPLLFPRGESGWHAEMVHDETHRTAQRTRVTQLQFYAYRLSPRRGFSILHNSGKLLQQYIVDAYIKTEGSRLNYLRQNQKNLRIELYQGLLDSLHCQAQNQNMRTGKLIILPSSFQGSPRHMQQNYQDAMAMVRKFGKPDLFLTFTCNPSWPEILNSLEHHQRPENRPDIVVRVFNMKLKEFLNDISKNNLFGKVLSYIYVIEFQKRGLPHAHILLTLDSDSKIRTKDDIDKYVSAELPDSVSEPRLFEIVTKCLIHGPCGTLNSNSPCMREGECSKNFPKELREDTEENVNGYPIYRRRVVEPVQIGKYPIDNRWVVPYNPWLIKKFNAHINVEVCASVKSVKYLYKYVYKGHDAASVKITSDSTLNHDEILSFVEGRYVSAPEAMWRLNEFSMSEKSHTVIRLAIHLPDQQPIVYQDGQEVQAVENASVKKTTLTAWFDLNSKDPQASTILYSEIPEYYVFDAKHTEWKKRQRGGSKVIGRLPVVNIQDTERYYLRMLLLRKPGAQSFEDLLTVDERVCNSFMQACRENGLLDGDQQWHDVLGEASQFQSPGQLRILFTMICAFGEVEDVLGLWEQHKDSLSEDFVHKYSEDMGPQYSLAAIEELLASYNLTLSKLNLPEVNLPNYLMGEGNNYDIREEQTKADLFSAQLNMEQKNAVETVLNAVYNSGANSPNCFFLDGPAGTGKTFVYSTLLHTIRAKGDSVIPVASTGIAATLLIGGRTAHSIFKIPIEINSTSTCNIKPNTKEADKLLKAKLIVWDEAPMTHIHAFIAVDRLLRDLTKSEKPFGGKVILLGGDFRQVLPVILRGSRALTVSSSIRKHSLWTKFYKLNLTKNMRALESEKEFADWLLNIGELKSGPLIKIPSECYPVIQDPVQQLYGDINFLNVTPHQLKNRAILTVKNDLSMVINNKVLQCMPGEETIYKAVDTVVSDDPQDKLIYPEEFINSLTPTGMPPYELKVKIGCIIMLLRNLAPSKGLCNGTRLIVTKLHRHVIEAKHIDGSEHFLIPRIPLIPSDSNMPFKFKRRQFPIRLAFSMTINKSQGQTFEKICLVLNDPVFSHGQLYVGFSRARSFESVSVVAPKNEVFNCVYEEVLSG